MIGVPIDVVIQENAERVFLGNCRSGTIGEKLKMLRREVRRHEMERMKALKDIVVASSRAEKAAEAGEGLAEIADRTNRLTDTVAREEEAMLTAAEQFVRTALGINYPPERVEQIMDALTDKHLLQCVEIHGGGQVPADFFVDPATRQRPSSTGPSAGCDGGSSSNMGTPVTTTKAGA